MFITVKITILCRGCPVPFFWTPSRIHFFKHRTAGVPLTSLRVQRPFNLLPFPSVLKRLRTVKKRWGTVLKFKGRLRTLGALVRKWDARGDDARKKREEMATITAQNRYLHWNKNLFFLDFLPNTAFDFLGRVLWLVILDGRRIVSLFYLDDGQWIFSIERLADVRKNCSRGGFLLKKIILDFVENRMSRLIRFIFNSLI